MAPNGRRGGSTRKVALGGVFAAVSVVCMLLGGIMPIASFTAPMVAGVFLWPIGLELGGKTATLAYVAVSVLSALMVADQEMVLFFIFLLGWYPIAYPTLTKIPSKLLQYTVKMLLFNLSVLIVYGIMLLLFTSPALREELASMGGWYWVGLLALGNVTFVLYDVLLGRLKTVYICRFKGKFLK